MTDTDNSNLQDLAEEINDKGGRKFLRRVAKGLNKTEEGRAESGGKYWTQALVFKALVAAVQSGHDPSEAIEQMESVAKSRREAAKEKADEEMGGVAALYSEIG